MSAGSIGSQNEMVVIAHQGADVDGKHTEQRATT